MTFSDADGGRTFLLGPQPPPVHGLAAANAAIRSAFEKAGLKVTICDIAARSLERSITARTSRLSRVWRALYRIHQAARSGDTLYLSISGGYGQLYEILFVALGRTRGMRCYLHHHNYRYIDDHSRVTELLIAIAGPAATHITLSKGMSEALTNRYPLASKCIPISNSVFLDESKSVQKSRSELRTIGYLSNISPEKGIFEFLDLVATLESQGLRLRAKLAGPFQDEEIEGRVRSRMLGLEALDYLGAVYGPDKEHFFNSIDVLIFPSWSEAEPFVVHEAMMHAVPVIAYRRGCIPEILSADAGLIVDPCRPFASEAVRQLRAWLRSPGDFHGATTAAQRAFCRTRESSLSRWSELLREIA